MVWRSEFHPYYGADSVIMAPVVSCGIGSLGPTVSAAYPTFLSFDGLSEPAISTADRSGTTRLVAAKSRRSGRALFYPEFTMSARAREWGHGGGCRAGGSEAVISSYQL